MTGGAQDSGAAGVIVDALFHAHLIGHGDFRDEAVSIVARHMPRATPAPAGWQEGNGWVFWNPDSGEEYAPNHPVESGECTDAESVRRSTPQEDTLYLAFQNEFARAEHLTNVLREIESSASSAVAGSRSFPTAPAEGGV